MRKLWTLMVVAVVTSVGFVGCSDKEDEEDVSSIVGTWVVKHSKWSESLWIYDSDGVKTDQKQDYSGEHDHTQDDQPSTWTFRSDKTGTVKTWDEDYEEYEIAEIKYSVTGNKLTVWDHDGDITDPEDAEVEFTFSISGNTLKLFVDYIDDEGEHHEEATLQRQ